MRYEWLLYERNQDPNEVEEPVLNRQLAELEVCKATVEVRAPNLHRPRGVNPVDPLGVEDTMSLQLAQPEHVDEQSRAVARCRCRGLDLDRVEALDRRRIFRRGRRTGRVAEARE